jgi:hypothetical protein
LRILAAQSPQLSPEEQIMSENTHQTAAQPSAVPARIQLDDFIEAVTRGVARALAAQDDVSGYVQQPGGLSRSIPQPIVIGIIAPPPAPFPDLVDLAGSSATLERR